MGTTNKNEKSIGVYLIEIVFHFRHMIHSGLTINDRFLSELQNDSRQTGIIQETSSNEED